MDLLSGTALQVLFKIHKIWNRLVAWEHVQSPHWLILELKYPLIFIFNIRKYYEVVGLFPTIVLIYGLLWFPLFVEILQQSFSIKTWLNFTFYRDTEKKFMWTSDCKKIRYPVNLLQTLLILAEKPVGLVSKRFMKSNIIFMQQ